MSVRVRPDVVASLTSALPARLIKRLDADPSVASRWKWDERADRTGAFVTTDGGETVTVTAVLGVLEAAEAIRCTCLLSPRCLHVIAVATSLGVAESEDEEAPKATGATLSARESADALCDMIPTTPRMRETAALTKTVCADLLRVGARGGGVVLVAELLRLVHVARTEGLHRLSGAGLRVARAIRALREDADDFSTSAYLDDLETLLSTAHALERETVDRAEIGVARRAYETIGGLRLHGVFTEPVLARGGYGGVVTHLVDDRGRLFTIGDVMPGGIDRAIGAYDAIVALGEASLAHRSLGRAGLFVQAATASNDGRLGAGKDVKAVRAQPSDGPWQVDSIRALFATPVREQLARAHTALALDEERRPRSAGLVFVRGRVIAHDAHAVHLASGESGETILRLVAANEHPSFSFVENLRRLAMAEGLQIQAIGRVDPRAPRTLALLAFAAGESAEAARLSPPSDLGGVVNSGYDHLGGAHMQATSPTREVSLAHDIFDPTMTLRRRVQRLALHGTIGAGALTTAERRALESVAMHGALRCLSAMEIASRAPGPRLTEAWLASSVYLRAARVALLHGALPSPGCPKAPSACALLRLQCQIAHERGDVGDRIDEQLLLRRVCRGRPRYAGALPNDNGITHRMGLTLGTCTEREEVHRASLPPPLSTRPLPIHTPFAQTPS